MKWVKIHLCADTSVLLYSSQQYPEYYKVIKEPIDLKMIYSQVKVGHFRLVILN